MLGPLHIARFALLVLVACGPAAPVDATSATSAATGSSTSTSARDDGASDDPPLPDLGGPVDSTATSPDTPPDGPGPVECATFDPGRVYVRGTLDQAASDRDALTDPEFPTAFCVGFEEHASMPRLDDDGRVVFVDESDVYGFAPDPLDWDRAAGTWIYPAQPYDNDDLVRPAPCDARNALSSILVAPSDGGVWVRCGGSWFDPSGTFVFESIDHIGVAVSLDDHLLVHDPDRTASLFFVEPGAMPDPPFDLPRGVDAVVTGRVHDGGLRLVAVEGERVFLWHLVGDSIGEEGEYSAIDVGPSIDDLARGALDVDGDYLHVMHATNENDIVVRRRLDPDPSEVVYQETDLDPYAARIQFYDLFTGP